MIVRSNRIIVQSYRECVLIREPFVSVPNVFFLLVFTQLLYQCRKDFFLNVHITNIMYPLRRNFLCRQINNDTLHFLFTVDFGLSEENH